LGDALGSEPYLIFKDFRDQMKLIILRKEEVQMKIYADLVAMADILVIKLSDEEYDVVKSIYFERGIQPKAHVERLIKYALQL
jgi:hypothetical protein